MKRENCGGVEMRGLETAPLACWGLFHSSAWAFATVELGWFVVATSKFQSPRPLLSAST